MSYSEKNSDFEFAIVGGGLGGLICAILLARQGRSVALFERKSYPFHRVCGEYISNEVVPFLESQNLFPHDQVPAFYHQFLLSSVAGKTLRIPLDLGGFGISRYSYDNWLANHAREAGVHLLTGTAVTEIVQNTTESKLILRDKSTVKCKLVIGAFGKRSTLDKTLERPFMLRRSPYIGVKYHIEADYFEDTVALHNFEGGYCGINRVEGSRYNLCYLSTTKNLRRCGNIRALEGTILQQNPHLQKIFSNANFLFEDPVVINEISFEKKGAIWRSIPMVGDAAGMITPLCGNGMAMAIHSAKVLSEIIASNSGGIDVALINSLYESKWNRLFAQRLWIGRKIQALFGGSLASSMAVNMGLLTPPIARYLMAKTHGQPF